MGGWFARRFLDRRSQMLLASAARSLGRPKPSSPTRAGAQGGEELQRWGKTVQGRLCAVEAHRSTTRTGSVAGARAIDCVALNLPVSADRHTADGRHHGVPANSRCRRAASRRAEWHCGHPGAADNSEDPHAAGAVTAGAAEGPGAQHLPLGARTVRPRTRSWRSRTRPRASPRRARPAPRWSQCAVPTPVMTDSAAGLPT